MVLLCLLIIGQSITLECGQVESILPFSYNWKLHGDLIDDEYSNTLTINNATSTNAGVYTCIVTSLVGQTSAEGVTVNVYAPPKFREQPDDVNYLMMQDNQFGENNVSFICEVSGIPRPDISWFYKDFEQMEEIALYQFNSELILDNINVSNAGIYYCKANNSHGIITSRLAKLNVLKIEFPEQFIEMGIDILKIERNTSFPDVFYDTSENPTSPKPSFNQTLPPTSFNQTSPPPNFNQTYDNVTISPNTTINHTKKLRNLTDAINYNDLYEDLAERLKSSTNQEIRYLSIQSKEETVTTLHFTVKSIIYPHNTNNDISKDYSSAKDLVKVSGKLFSF